MKITNQSNLTSEYLLPDGTTDTSNVDSNESTTEYMTESFLKVKSSSKSYGKPGDELTQTIVLTNNSDYEIEDISIIDTMSEGASYVAGSVTINGTPQPDYDIGTGFSLDAPIASGESLTITYKITINNQLSVSEITNTAQVTYSVNEVTDLVENTNTVTIETVNNNITITKTSSASAVIRGQTLTFYNDIKNEGTIKNTNLFFKDPIPANTKFIAGSVKIDDTAQPTYDPETGFALPDLDAGGQIRVSFEVNIL